MSNIRMRRKSAALALWSLAGVLTALTVPTTAQAVPPRISGVTPAPADWIVNGSQLTQVALIFNQQVTVSTDGITAYTLAGGPLGGLVISPLNTLTPTATVTFPGIGLERLAVVVTPDDDDGDRVLNDNDLCLDTPANTEVDADGCPIQPAPAGRQGTNCGAGKSPCGARWA
ncbi:MAG: hypothetical protein V2A79_03145 [Planctomycetota bacterium]